jgi:serine/threonine protein kinase
MSKVMEEVTEISASKTLTFGGSARYVAPELIESNDMSATMCSDTYSFAMLILESATQRPPFADLRRDAAVIHAIVNKKQCPVRPETPEAKRWITDEIWELMRKCWSTSPASRPTMDQVHAFFLRNTT